MKWRYGSFCLNYRVNWKSSLLFDGATETVKQEIKKQENRFLDAAMVPFASSLIAPMASSLIQPVPPSLINVILAKGTWE